MSDTVIATRTMFPVTGSFEFDYFGSDIVYGRGCIQSLEDRLREHGLERALIVCGRNVGANDELMDPITESLGETLCGVFDETTPAKALDTVYDGIQRMDTLNPDVLVGVGGGSSLDIARQMSVFNADGRPLSEFRDAAQDGRSEPPTPTDELAGVVVIPTTFAGADLSSGGSVEVLPASTSPTGQPIRTSGSVMPIAMVYDPNLFDTTPLGALAGSAMNGFDKGIESLYAKEADPITDATAVHGLRMLRDGFPNLDRDDPIAMERSVIGIILVQFQRKTSIVHAFGHGFARRYPVQQGNVHAIVVPHVLRYLFSKIDANREIMAAGFGILPDSVSHDDLAGLIIDEVVGVRDIFELPTRLRELDPVRRDDFPAIAEFILTDYSMDDAPEDLEPTADELEEVLHNAW